MKPLVIFALWAFVGWDVGAWAETLSGIPSAVGLLAGVALGAALAIEARRQIAAAAARLPQALAPRSSFEGASALDRAA